MKIRSVILASLSLCFASATPAAGLDRPFVHEIRDAATFDAMAEAPSGVVRTGKIIKFLIDNRKYPGQPEIYFINGNSCSPEDKKAKRCPSRYVELHRTFAARTLSKFTDDPAEFNSATYY